MNLISDDRKIDDEKIDEIFAKIDYSSSSTSSKLPPINHNNNNNIILRTKDEIEAPSVSSVISVVKANKLSQQHRKQQRERPPSLQPEKDQKLITTHPAQQTTLLTSNTCLWKDCGKQFGSSGNLFEHLQVCF